MKDASDSKKPPVSDTFHAAMLMYGTGLRLLECLTLRVKDIDFGYRQITVQSASRRCPHSF